MIEQLRELVREMRESSDSHAQAGTRYSEADDVENANLRWGMAEVLRIAAAKCESLLTQRPKGESLLPAQPAATFVNAGDSEAQFIADGEHLNCSTCGGSGHVDDASRSVVSELLGALEGVVAVADRQTDEFDRARAAIAMAKRNAQPAAGEAVAWYVFADTEHWVTMEEDEAANSREQGFQVRPLVFGDMASATSPTANQADAEDGFKRNDRVIVRSHAGIEHAGTVTYKTGIQYSVFLDIGVGVTVDAAQVRSDPARAQSDDRSGGEQS